MRLAGFFLQKLTSSKDSRSLQHTGIFPRVLALLIGVPGTNKLLLKIEATRLALWIEEEMQKQYGSKRRAKEEIFARYASFVYLGNGRYGFAAASDYYFAKPIEAFTVEDADKAMVAEWGPEIRRHPHFGPRGTNVNFVQVLGPNGIRVRTFERGVEGETLACGTGVSASALVAAAVHGFLSPVPVQVQGGDQLEVGFKRNGNNFSDVKLTGPADFVFEGRTEI